MDGKQFTCNLPIIPRIGDTIPQSSTYFGTGKVVEVTLLFDGMVDKTYSELYTQGVVALVQIKH